MVPNLILFPCHSYSFSFSSSSSASFFPRSVVGASLRLTVRIVEFPQRRESENGAVPGVMVVIEKSYSVSRVWIVPSRCSLLLWFHLTLGNTYRKILAVLISCGGSSRCYCYLRRALFVFLFPSGSCCSVFCLCVPCLVLAPIPDRSLSHWSSYFCCYPTPLPHVLLFICCVSSVSFLPITFLLSIVVLLLVFFLFLMFVLPLQSLYSSSILLYQSLFHPFIGILFNSPFPPFSSNLPFSTCQLSLASILTLTPLCPSYHLILRPSEYSTHSIARRVAADCHLFRRIFAQTDNQEPSSSYCSQSNR